MIEDPPPPRGMRPRSLIWPAVALLVLMTMPPAVSLALIGAALLARGSRRAVQHVRARDADIAARAAAGPAITIGRDSEGRPVQIPERTLAAHGLILGATGAGKSTTLLTLLSDQIRRGRPVVAIDLKGSPAFAGELRA
ncbi:MAG TPA: helicase HerA-like domain-containing protein, partial [Solirubrobacteraceae bacterium]|nr:helicase HerA-like domain-containing protein [Solirubrobacteraceae bacterium]